MQEAAPYEFVLSTSERKTNPGSATHQNKVRKTDPEPVPSIRKKVLTGRNISKERIADTQAEIEKPLGDGQHDIPLKLRIDHAGPVWIILQAKNERMAILGNCLVLEFMELWN
ncbi:MAG: hypothetical protein ACLU3F_11370 [Blautia wexlerae]